MKWLLTGGTGFLGSHLADRLLKDGHEVVIIDRSIKYQNLLHPKEIKIYHENILENVGDIFKDIDIVVHMAALSRPQWSIKYPYETNEVNVNGTIRVLEHSKNNNIKRVVFLSSSSLYGEQETYPTPEDVKPNPMSPYAVSKLIGEQYCKMFEQLYGLEFNAIRPFNVYGTRMPKSGVYTSAVATFIDIFKKNLPLQMNGDGSQRRDFIYIDDVVDQIMLASTSKVHGEAFNCGSGVNTSINELLEAISKLMKKEVTPTRIPTQFEPDQTLADISKAEKLLGWKPKIDLEEGLRLTIEGTI